MKLIKLENIFNISYGNGFSLNQLQVSDLLIEDTVNYISRTRENNGVSANVSKIEGIKPFSAGLITVAGSGNSVLESFIQPYPFYTGYHVFILEPKKPMTDEEKLFYCFCIRANQFKYNFGRQANRTLKDIEVPDEMPIQFRKNILDVNTLNKQSLINKSLSININNWDYFVLSDFFFFKKGKEIIYNCKIGDIPLVSSSAKNNGVSKYIISNALHQGNVITLAVNGSVGEAFYQYGDFAATSDIVTLRPKFSLNKYIAIFICTVLRKEKFRFNYGRKWNIERLKDFKIKLPAKNHEPDWQFMEDYIKSLPYSSSL